MKNPKKILKEQLDAVKWGNITAVEPVIETWICCAKASGVEDDKIKEALSTLRFDTHQSIGKSLKKFHEKV